MPEISVGQAGTIADPHLKKIGDDVADTVLIAAEKATGHLVDPGRYPLSQSANSLERILSERLTSLNAQRQNVAKEKGRVRLAVSQQTREREFGRLARVSLTDRRAVEEQVRALGIPNELKITEAELDVAVLTPVSIAPAIFRPAQARLPIGGIVLPQVPRKLEFRLHQVLCADETGGYWTEKVGNDEISLGASAIDATGTTTKINQFTVYNDFDDGDHKDYAPPKVLKTFDLTVGTKFPKTYFMVLALAEIDMGGFADWLNKLVDKIKDEIVTKLAALIGGAIGSTGGPVGAAIGLLVGYAVGKAIEWLKAWWSDDIFTPVTVNVEIPYRSARFGTATDSPDVVARFTGHDGDYRVTYDWRLTDFVSARPVATQR